VLECLLLKGLQPIGLLRVSDVASRQGDHYFSAFCTALSGVAGPQDRPKQYQA
jgi:hypothetical protein